MVSLKVIFMVHVQDEAILRGQVAGCEWEHCHVLSAFLTVLLEHALLSEVAKRCRGLRLLFGL